MDPTKEGQTPENDAAVLDDEAQWVLTTARALHDRGDLESAVTWYRRAVDHLMSVGQDELALEVARLASGISATPPRATTPNVPNPRATQSSPPATQSSPPALVPTAIPARVATRPSQVPNTFAAIRLHHDADASIEVSISGEVSAEESMDLLRALRAAITFQPMRATSSELLAQRLGALALFRELPPETVRAVARQVSVVHFEQGEVMLAPGTSTPDAPLYVLLEGRGLLRAVGDEGPGTPLGPGDFVGEIQCLYGGRCVLSATVRARVTAVAVPRSLTAWLAREFPSVRVALEDVAWERAFGSIGRGAPFLRRLPPDQRGVAYARFEPVLLNAGDLLLGEGAPPLAFWLMAAGEVEVYGGGINGRQPLRAHAGDAIGLRAILEGEPSGVSARTLGTVLAAKVGLNTFRGLIDRHPALADAMEDIGIPGRAVVC